MCELDIIKNRDDIYRFRNSIKGLRKELKDKFKDPTASYVKDAVREEFQARYNEIYEELFKICERLDKLENN